MSISQQPVPPEPSSHTPEGAPTATDVAAPPQQQIVRVNRLAYMGVALLLFGVSFPVLGYPAMFGWLLLAPVAAVVWSEIARTTVDTEGVGVRTFAGSRFFPWSEISGIGFPKRGAARLKLADGREQGLPNVSFRWLPLLSQASGGRIPNPYADVQGVPSET